MMHFFAKLFRKIMETTPCCTAIICLKEREGINLFALQEGLVSEEEDFEIEYFEPLVDMLEGEVLSRKIK